MPRVIALLGLSVAVGIAAAWGTNEAHGDGYQATIVGSWIGTLPVPGAELRIVFHIAAADDGELTATMDSPDQGATGIPVSDVTVADGHVRLVSAMVGGEFEGDLSADGLQIVGEWRQSGATLPLTVTKTEEDVEGPVRPQEPEPPLPYDQEDVVYANEQAGIQLAATLTLPRSAAPHPAVVLISGSGPQDRNETVMGHRPFLVLPDYLTRHGIAVLRFDDRGVGGSTGDFTTATSEDFATDVLAGVSYLLGRDDIDGGNIGLIGHSEGGLIAPMVAAQSDEVAFIVLMAGPAVTGEEIILAQSVLISQAAGRAEVDIQKDIATNKRVFEIVKNEPDREVAAREIEKLLTAAAAVMTPEELDLQVPPDQNLPVMQRVLEESGKQDYAIEELPGLNHLFQTAITGALSEYATIEETIAPSVLELRSEWILERVGRESGIYDGHDYSPSPLTRGTFSVGLSVESRQRAS